VVLSSDCSQEFVGWVSFTNPALLLRHCVCWVDGANPAYGLGIHKRGDSYLRGLLVHGARSVLRAATNKPDDRSRWLMNLSTRKHRYIATVAQANKTARIAWAVLARNECYRP